MHAKPSRTYTLTLGLIAGVLLGFLGGCTTARIPATSLKVPLLDIPLPAVFRGENDLRSRTWVEAFEILHQRMEREYAYGEHKAVNWEALHARFSAEVAAAESVEDTGAWYRALRGYLYSIPDGNVQIDLNDTLRIEAEGASAGLALTTLSDGSVMVTNVLPESPAAEAGIEPGATVIGWNDTPVAVALGATSILWADAPPATPYMRLQQQLIWLPRGNDGEPCHLTYRNPGSTEEATASLAFTVDELATLPLYRPLVKPTELFASPIQSRMLDGGQSYIRVAAFAPTLSTPFPVRDFRTAVRAAVDGSAPAMIVDLRGTQGGDPTLVPKMLSFFVTEPTFYATPGVWDSELEMFLVETEESVTVQPQMPAYEGKIVVLVDAYTMGPPESFALFMERLDNVTIYGRSGTYGSPDTPTAELTLPGNYAVTYPTKRLLDQEGNIQGVTNAAGEGNVTPDTMVELDPAGALAIYQDGQDVVLDRAVEML